jgi:hypothetical protein
LLQICLERSSAHVLSTHIATVTCQCFKYLVQTLCQ